MGDSLDDFVQPGTDDEDIKGVVGSSEHLDAAKDQAHSTTSGITMKSTMSLQKREKWGSKTQFLMSCIASAVGLGNVWRFPAICAKYGGASFFFPYMIVLFVIARPLFVLELALGQFSSKGSVRCWDLSPIFTGVGYAGSLSSVLLSTFYILLMAWALHYTYLSLMSMSLGEVMWGNNSGQFFGEVILHDLKFDAAENAEFQNWIPHCHLILVLLVAWLIIWFTMVGGVEASGKVAYVTAMAPYVVLITLVVVGFCLEGSDLGLQYLFYPDWKLLADPRTWYEAVGQCFFSLGIGFGGLIMFSSFNDFHHDIFNDVLIISIVDFATSILAGLSLMSILGFQATQAFSKLNSGDIAVLAHNCSLNRGNWETENWLKLCKLREIVKDGGAGLAFVQYPAAMYEINERWGNHWGGFFGILFFVMLILLAIGSANGFVGTTVTIVADRRSDWKRSNIVSGVCCVSFFLGLIYTNSFGSSWIDVMDSHGVTAVVYILGMFEAVAVFGVYGLKNFCDDLEFMRMGRPVNLYIRITWVLLPFLLLIVYIAFLFLYEVDKHWTVTVQVIGWMITVGCILVIPAFSLAKIFQFKKNPWKRNPPTDFLAIASIVSKPSPRWGPKDPETRAAWKEFKKGRPTSYNIWGKTRAFFLRLFGKGKPTQYLSDPLPSNTQSAHQLPDELIPGDSEEIEAGPPNVDSLVGSSASSLPQV